tara:strand:+ start:498 stop:1166 length:669 start_codon:yes stop_codon:yes gene_type:complete
MYNLFKRFIDIVLSLLAVCILLPVFIPIILILKFTGEGEVFYLQERVGLHKKSIKIFKFATMLKDSENMGSGIYTAKNDTRILPLGNFLRKTKINELPQILNIFIGDISMVGPRPLIKRTFDLYDPSSQEIISSIKPGLTGVGSIIFRNEEELLQKTNLPLEDFYAKEITPYKADLEIWYASNRSLYCDGKIIFLTAWVIVFSKSNLPWSLLKGLPSKPSIL